MMKLYKNINYIIIFIVRCDVRNVYRRVNDYTFFYYTYYYIFSIDKFQILLILLLLYNMIKL